MSRIGRPRKPTSLKIIEGNRGKRALSRDEPHPAPLSEPPMCPSHLAPEAREEWHRRAPELWQLGVLTSVDVPLFEAYCEAYARMRQAENVMRRMREEDPLTQGITVPNKDGVPVHNPVLVALHRAVNQVCSLASEFGMTPAGRSRVSAKPRASPEDALNRLLG